MGKKRLQKKIKNHLQSSTHISSPGTAASLSPTKKLNTGLYQVPVEIKDLQGHGDVQTVTIRICKCKNGVCMAQERSISFGPLGWLALLLPLILLLLLCK